MIFLLGLQLMFIAVSTRVLGILSSGHDYIYKSYPETAGQSNNPIHESLANHQTDITNECLGNIW